MKTPSAPRPRFAGLSFAFALALVGCAPTGRERFGDVARYAPSYGGYVVGHDDDTLVLRHPVTGEKLRCRAEVERAAGALAAALDDAARDRRAAEIAPPATLPFYVVGTASSLLAIGLIYPAMAVHEGATAAQPRALYVAARKAFLAGRWSEAREGFLAVVIERGRGSSGVSDLPPIYVERSLYYVAVASEALHRDAEAAAALRRFLDTATGRDDVRYVDAEARLARLHPGGAACAARGDVRLAGGAL